jgi:hypothetical protein
MFVFASELQTPPMTIRRGEDFRAIRPGGNHLRKTGFNRRA